MGAWRHTLLLWVYLTSGLLSLWSAALLLTAPSAQAEFLGIAQTPMPSAPAQSFVAPNEHELQFADPLWQLAPRGLYVAVGTERGFIGASRVADATGLLLLDYDPEVVRFNRINTALLQMARDRKDYLALRERLNFEDWSARILSVEPSLKASVTLENWTVFRTQLEDAGFQRIRERSDTYLADDAMFEKIHALAKAGRIESHPFNLDAIAASANTVSVDTIANALLNTRTLIGVLDLSNAWWERYVSSQGLGHTLDALLEYMKPESLLMATDFPEKLSFRYFAFQTSNIRTYGTGEQFVSRLRAPETLDRLRCSILLGAKPKTFFNRHPEPVLNPKL